MTEQWVESSLDSLKDEVRILKVLLADLLVGRRISVSGYQVGNSWVTLWNRRLTGVVVDADEHAVRFRTEGESPSEYRTSFCSIRILPEESK